MATIDPITQTYVNDRGETVSAKTGQVVTQEQPSSGTNAMDSSGNPTYVANPDLNPQFKYDSPTVLYSGNVQEEKIPELNKSLKTLQGQGGTYQTSDGKQYYSYDNSPVPAPIGAMYTDKGWEAEGKMYGAGPAYVEGEDETSMAHNALLTSMKQSLDSTTAAMINSYQKQYEVKRQLQKKVNERQAQAVEQSLLMGGSSRYAPLSSSGITAEQESTGLLAISQLDAEEQQLIAQAKQAQMDGNWKLLDKSITLAETKRKEKQEATQKMNEQIAEENKKMRESLIKANKDDAILQLYNQGITDPAKIASTLMGNSDIAKMGGITLKEISDSIKAISPTGEGLSADLKTFYELQKTGGLPSSIMGLPKDKQYLAFIKALNDAQRESSGGGGGGIGNSMYRQAIYDNVKSRSVNFTSLPKEDKQIAIEEFQRRGETIPRALTEQEKNSQLDAIDGLYAVDEIDKMFKANELPLFTEQVFGDSVIARKLGASEFINLAKEATDVKTRIRTGAALNESEITFYASQRPQFGDDEAAIQSKINQLRGFYLGMSGMPVTVTNPTSGESFTFEDLFDQKQRLGLRKAISEGYTLNY